MESLFPCFSLYTLSPEKVFKNQITMDKVNLIPFFIIFFSYNIFFKKFSNCIQMYKNGV